MKQAEFYLAEVMNVMEEVLASGGTFRLYPKGTSMLPLIVQGRDSVVLKRCDPPARKNDIVLYRRDNGQYVLHRVVRIERNGAYTMRGDNQMGVEKGILPTQIIACVETLYQGEKPLDLQSVSYRRYVWSRSNPILRRFFLGMEHRKRLRTKKVDEKREKSNTAD